MDNDSELNDIMDSNPNGQMPKIKINGMQNYGVTQSAVQTYSFTEDDVDETFEKGYCQWSTTDGTIFKPTSQTIAKLTPGVYEISVSPNIGLFLEKIPVKTEGLLRFPDSNSDAVIEEIAKFWDREEVFKEYKLIYKRGILLWGPPGSGKSCTVQLIMEDVISRGGLIIRFDDPDLFLDGMRAIRKIQPNTPIVVIMEDIDSIISDNSESEVLNILDGVNEVHKVVFLATTNYPDRLGKRIVNRPSRFDKRFKIGMPNKASRRLYLEQLFQNVNEEERGKLSVDLDQWSKDTEELSIAHLKELFVAVVILGDAYKDAIKTLQNMKEDIDDDDHLKGFGFDLPKSR